MSSETPKSDYAALQDGDSVEQDPVIVELQPGGDLLALVFSHELTSSESIPCWTYVSRGLEKLGQKEVVFTVRRKEGEAQDQYPPEPLRWFNILHSLAKNGRLANDDYSTTQFSATEWFGRSDITMIIYTRPQPLCSLRTGTLPQTYLQAVPLTEPEANVASRHGVLRALSHLGLSFRYFPYPPWIDRDRKTTISLEELSGSILSQVPTVNISGVQAVKEGVDVRLFVRPSATTQFQSTIAQFAPQHAFAILSELHEEADACLVWKHGQVGPTAIGTTTKCTNLCFLMICPQQTETTLGLHEDGYVLLLTDPDWKNIRSSIASVESFTLPTISGSKFYLEMMRDTYVNPVDGMKHVSSGGWKTYHPSGPPPTEAEQFKHDHAKMSNVALLCDPTPEECPASVLIEYIKILNATIASLLPKTNPIANGSGKALIIHVDIRDGAIADVKFVSKPNPDGMDLDLLRTSVMDIPLLSGMQCVNFNITWDVWGGDKAV